jgi:hypothetical protein
MVEDNRERKRLSRRDLLKGGLLAGALFTLRKCLPRAGTGEPTLIAQGVAPTPTQSTLLAPNATLTPEAYLPYVSRQTGADASGRVVHVHDPDATGWDFGNDYYGNSVDQDVVNEMVDQGVMELTDASSVAQAWQSLIPDYTPGKAVAIKVNFNNSYSSCGGCLTNCEDYQLKIDALIHPINAVIRGLKVAYPILEHSDIWVYDASPGQNPPSSHRIITGRFTDDCLYNGVRFFDRECREEATFSSTDPTAQVTFSPPQGIPTPSDQKITDVLINATYAINMPIMKRHMFAGVTLGFKNHFGSIDDCKLLHQWIALEGDYYGGTAYNPLVELCSNPNIRDKTVLTIGDGLFGNWESNERKSQPWSTFGNQAPNSLFFATDPVAIDSVMCDFLYIEGYRTDERWRDYLVVAEAAELGVHEQGDPWQKPWGSGYSKIDYGRIEL